MGEGSSSAPPGTTLLLFGPQVLSFNKQSFDKLRETLSDGRSHQWILEVVAELPRYWDIIAEKLPGVRSVPGEKLLSDLDRWFRMGVDVGADFDLPNILLTPLVVLTQLTQYSRYLELNHDVLGSSFPQKDTETLGFCTGLLSALAVSSSANQEQFRRYGAVAVRLAMLIGALVDAQEASDKVYGRAKSFATAWTSPEQSAEMSRIIDHFPEAYKSVLYDEKRATVTTSERTAPMLLQQFKSVGITAAEVGLRGRFHCQQYVDQMDSVIELCNLEPAFQFPDSSELALPSIINVSGGPINIGRTHQLALQAILVEQSNWYQQFAAVQSLRLSGKDSLVVSFGPDRCVPPSLMRKLGPRLVHFADMDQDTPRLFASVLDPEAHSGRSRNTTNNDIAIIGMSVKVAGADDLEEFWDIIREGKSQHIEVPESRFNFETQWRETNTKRKWYGNFLRDVDMFDHKFFKRSPREIESMDPQQRLMLQAAYQAVEQSGYFALPNVDKHIGCYIGVCLTDYEHNVACYPPNSFTAIGNLKSFIPGKVAHYFGWTGPSMAIDTACSASAVAIHTACRAIINGECSSALAGGVAVMENPLWFQNLAGATFLSPTGQCKPFDELADGYCRGEGIACVFLKKMSVAIADGNTILGCIPSTAVYQNQNCTPLFVPNSPSLSHLFRDVLRQSRLEPEDISVVEAHGTGTPVGDPAEYESIRLALGGPIRSKPLLISSVKGLIGHTEGTSGVIALIKVLLMMYEGYIPPQASFSKMSSHIQTSPSDMMEVPTRLRPWTEEYKAALINNYGASGSNASLVVTQSMQNGTISSPIHTSNIKHPFWIAAFSEKSLAAYCTKLLQSLKSKAISSNTPTLADLSFNICRQSNRAFSRGLIFSCGSIAELQEKLATTQDSAKTLVKAAPPVVLCFGGQVSTFVGLDYKVYESVQLLRSYLDQCNAVIQSLGLDGIYPEIFQKSPVEDTVKLQTMLFAMQYSCAKCWIDCGVKVEAVVGHSFGEITALCIAGILSVKDTVKLVVGRAKLVRDMWGDDCGSMMAVEGDLDIVEQLLAESNKLYDGDRPASIACYNGPRSFTLAGSSNAIGVVTETKFKDARFSPMKMKKLNVTNAFHSTLVEPLMENLEQIGRELNFKEPVIHMERATEYRSEGKWGPNFVPEHMRNPVFFNNAIQRLSKQYPSCIWLEAGSSSTITIMTNRALGSSAGSHFQSMNLTNDKGMDALTDSTITLWNEGLRVSSWTHHTLQAYEYSSLILPPYQFEKSRHWLDLKKPVKAITIIQSEPTIQEEVPLGLWTFVGYQDTTNRAVRFRINTMSKKYADFVAGHLIAQTASICPATLEVDMVIEALLSIRPDFSALQPQILNMENHVPVCVDPSRFVWIDYEALDVECHSWVWKIISNGPDESRGEIQHAHGKIVFRASDYQQYQVEFGRFERMVRHKQCLDILQGDDVDDIIQGRNIYKAFSEIVDYGEMYRGLKKVVGKGLECAGRIQKKYSGETWLDAILSDCAGQVSGLWVNCMTDRAPGDMFIASAIELIMRSPKVQSDYQRPETWDVYARSHRESDKLYLSDVFVFDSDNGLLVEVMLGIQYAKVPKASMSKILTRLTAADAIQAPPSVASKVDIQSTINAPAPLSKTSAPAAAKPKSEKKKKASRPDLADKVRTLVANVSGLEADEMDMDSELADFGIDSLMGMELAREVEIVFKCTLNQNELMEATTFRKFVKCIAAALGDSDNSADGGEDDTDDSSSSNEGEFSDGPSNDDTPASPLSSSTPNIAEVKIIETSSSNLRILQSDILTSFGQTKMLTDKLIVDYKIDNLSSTFISQSNKLCVALVVEAFEQLGCPIQAAAVGKKLERISYKPQHTRLVEYLYDFLEKEARLIDVGDSGITRTAILAPKKPAATLIQELMDNFPEWFYANKLTYYAGKNLADVLVGKTDGIRLIFGTPEGRELVSGLYCDHPFNKLSYDQMKDFIDRLISRLPMEDGPLKILEMGAGVGGTTMVLVPFLASLNIPVEYIFTDLSASMVALARRKYKEYPFMKFMVHDIEKTPPEDLRNQHIVIASNAVHATHSLNISAKNIHAALRPDGFLMMLEMTEIVPWVDIIFGLLEGWWLFEDGRPHAIAPSSRWERDLQSAGFKHVDWTDGALPENSIQKVIIALASGPINERLPKPEKQLTFQNETMDVVARQKDSARYVEEYSAGFISPVVVSRPMEPAPHEQCVFLTGATGSLGSHLVSHLAEHPDVQSVVCLNRRSSSTAEKRQQEALTSRGIFLSAKAQSKLKVIETDTSKPKLGLSDFEYQWLVQHVTHIIHNAWPMSSKRPIKAFEMQFQALRNLIDFARDISCQHTAGFKVSFQFISSIGVVGHYPLWSGRVNVPEERMEMKSVLTNGYCEAKFTCESILEATIHRYPQHFRSMSVRLGQIAGSRTSGYWNPVEHFPFLIKSSQSLRALPAFEGILSWVPVNDVAGTLVDLIVADTAPYPFYHIDNPDGQPWNEMLQVLADALDIPQENIIPFEEWVQRVRRSPMSSETENPASRLIDFLDDHFLRMSCGGLLLDTNKTREHSKTLATQGPVSTETTRKFVKAWKEIGFLN